MAVLFGSYTELTLKEAKKAKLISSTFEIGHFRVPPGLCIKKEVKCSDFDMEMFFYSHANKTHFRNNGCALGLILKERVLGTRKWPLHTSISGKALNALKSVMVLPLPGGPQRTMGLCSASHVYKSASCRTVSTVGTTTSGAATL